MWSREVNHLIAGIVCFAASLFSSAIAAQSDAIVPPPGESARSNSPSNADFNLQEDIRRAQELLRRNESGHDVRMERKTVSFRDRRGRTRKKVLTSKIIEPVFLLAVQDLKERSISKVRYTSKGCATNGFDVVMARRNGVGSLFEVRRPQHMAVLALRTTVHNEEKGFKEVVYTPYSPEIDTPQLRQEGLNYLRGRIETARAGLAEANVPLKVLHALPDSLSLSDIALVLSIIEHIDPLRFNNCPPGEESALVNEVLTVVGANKENAYAYSRSSAGARGLFQFIPGTYEKILRKYPQAGLVKDFVSGCTDHVNAAKASLLLFDSDLSDLPDDYFRAISRDVQTIGQYLAASYNCGSRRVERSLRNRSDGWTCILPQETRTYLRKFDTVWNMRHYLRNM